MVVVGFGYTRIEAEKRKGLSGNINISNNIAIKEVEEYNFPNQEAKPAKDKRGLRFTFEFVSNYAPDAARISLLGELFYLADKKASEEILASWKKDKKIPKEVLGTLLNYISNRSHVEAIILSREINLPPPLPMPKISVDKPADNYIG